MFTVHLGLQKTVVLAGYEAVREALVGTGQELAGRPPIAIFQLIQGGGGRCVVQQGLRQVRRRGHQLCSWGLPGTGPFGPWKGPEARALPSRQQDAVAPGEGQVVPVASGAGGVHRGRHIGKGRGPAEASSLGSGWGQGAGPALPPAAPLLTAARPAGIFFSSGARWKAARQFTVRALHGLGVGRQPVADKVLQELSCLVGQLDHYGGEWGAGALLPGAPPPETVPRPPPALPPGSAQLGQQR